MTYNKTVLQALALITKEMDEDIKKVKNKLPGLIG